MLNNRVSQPFTDGPTLIQHISSIGALGVSRAYSGQTFLFFFRLKMLLEKKKKKKKYIYIYIYIYIYLLESYRYLPSKNKLLFFFVLFFLLLFFFQKRF